MIMVGDRGMITSARIKALRELGGHGWITCLRAPAIQKPWPTAARCRCRLFDEQDLAEITSPTTPASGSSPAATRCWPPSAPASARSCSPPPKTTWRQDRRRAPPGGCQARTRSACAPAKSSTSTRSPSTSSSTSPTTSFAWRARPAPSPPRPPSTASTSSGPPSPPASLDAAAVVDRLQEPRASNATSAHQGRRPGPAAHPPPARNRVRAHVLICMLARYLIWHLRQAWAPLTFTDEHPPGQREPRRPRPPLRRRRRQGHAARPPRPAHPQLPRPARPPGHPHPQRPTLRRRDHPRPHRAHHRPSGAPSTSSAPASRSPWAQRRHHKTRYSTANPQIRPQPAHLGRRNFGLTLDQAIAVITAARGPPVVELRPGLKDVRRLAALTHAYIVLSQRAYGRSPGAGRFILTLTAGVTDTAAAHQQLGGPLVVVWDNLNTLVSAAMTELIAARAG